MHELASFLPLSFTLIGVFAGAFIAGFAGFGLAAAAGAFLLHVLPATTAVPLMMLCSVVAQTIGLIVLRKSMDFRGAVPFLLSGALAIPIALTILGTTDSDAFKLGFGAFLVLYTSYSLSALLLRRPKLAVAGGAELTQRVPRQGGSGAVVTGCVGFAGGLIGGLTAMPGAALSVWADIRGGDKIDRRSVVQPFILCMQVFALGCLAATGQLFSEEIIRLFAISILPLVLGTGLGLALFGRVNSGTFRTSVLALILMSGLMMVIK